MIRAAIVTPWVSAENDPSPMPCNHPLFGDEYTYIRWEDITGQDSANILPDPNEYTLLVEVEDLVFAAIENDPDYEVLWHEQITEAQPNG